MNDTTEIENINQQGIKDTIYRLLAHLPKNAPTAIFEIIDNSIDSRRDNDGNVIFNKVDICVSLKEDIISVRDNGIGINKQLLRKCLAPYSTKIKENAGIGKYGVGLKTSAFYLAKKLTIITTEKDSDIVYIADINLKDFLTIDDKNIYLIPENWIKEIKKIDQQQQESYENFEHGTIIILTELNQKINQRIEKDLIHLSAHNFQKFLSKNECSIIIKGKLIKYAEIKLIPETIKMYEIFNTNGKSIKVKLGVKKNDSDKRQDMAGLNMFWQGKLIKKQEFTFGLKRSDHHGWEFLYLEADCDCFAITPTKDAFSQDALYYEFSDLVYDNINDDMLTLKKKYDDKNKDEIMSDPKIIKAMNRGFRAIQDDIKGTTEIIDDSESDVVVTVADKNDVTNMEWTDVIAKEKRTKGVETGTVEANDIPKFRRKKVTKIQDGNKQLKFKRIPIAGTMYALNIISHPEDATIQRSYILDREKNWLTVYINPKFTAFKSCPRKYYQFFIIADVLKEAYIKEEKMDPGEAFKKGERWMYSCFSPGLNRMFE